MLMLIALLRLVRPAASSAADAAPECVPSPVHPGTILCATANVPSEILKEAFSYISDADLYETFMRGREFDHALQDIQKFANLSDRKAALAYSLKLNSREIAACFDLEALRERYSTALSSGTNLPDASDTISAGVLAVLTRMLTCRQQLLTSLRGATMLNSLLYENLFARCFNAVGLLVAANLAVLYMENTKVTDLTPLSTLSKLMDLNLRGNPVTNLAPLATLTNLRILYLSGTGVTDFGPLRNLTKLHHLELIGVSADREPLRCLLEFGMRIID